MGANAWRLRLLDRDVDVSHEHGFLGGDDWRHPDQYQPWRVESPQLVLVSWKPAAFLYDLERQKPTVCNLSGHILAAMASRTLPRVALQGLTTTSLLDVKGKVVAVLPENPGQTERPALTWFDKANCLLVVGRERAGSPTTMAFFEATTGKAIGSVPLDPKALLPYPDSDYASIGRDRYSLILSRTTRCVGRRLDVWTQVHFDDSRSFFNFKRTGQPVNPSTQEALPFVKPHRAGLKSSCCRRCILSTCWNSTAARTSTPRTTKIFSRVCLRARPCA